ncbi:hypothetical protein [Guggenheimella bovis]
MRIISILLCLVLLVSCTPKMENTQTVEGSTVIHSTEQKETDTPQSTESKVEEVGGVTTEPEAQFKLVYNGVSIVPKKEWAPALEKLGAPTDKGEAPSCAFEGKDIKYTYPGLEVQTAMIQGVETVTGAFITDTSAKTPEGLTIGSSIDDMKKAYGENFTEEFGSFTYDQGEYRLNIVVIDDKVTAISYIGNFGQ